MSSFSLKILFMLPLLVWSQMAAGNNKSWFTAAFAFHSVKSNMSDASSPFGAGINMGYQVRIRFFRIFHLEYDYNLTRIEGEGIETPDSPSKLAREPRHAVALSVDLAYTPLVNTYILGGAGKGESQGGYEGVVYFGGVGLEIPFNSHWALAAEARLVVPSMNEVETYLQKKYGSKGNASQIESLSDFYNSNNYQIFFALRYYY